MKRKPKRSSVPIEYSLLLTATLCLLAFGVVMVFSASSTTQLLGDSGDSAFYLKRTIVFGALGLVVMHLLARRGVKFLRPLTPVLLGGAIFLCLIVNVPGVGIEVNGSRAWLGAGPVQIQPSELMKLALILFTAHLLATRPEVVSGGIRQLAPVLAVVGAGVLVVGVGDLGTALVTCFAITALLVGAGARLRDIGHARRRRGRGRAPRGDDRAVPRCPDHLVSASERRSGRGRLPADPGEDRARLRRPVRRRARREPAEGLLPARGPHRHDRRRHRRGARNGRDRGPRRPLRHVRLRRLPHRPVGP